MFKWINKFSGQGSSKVNAEESVYVEYDENTHDIHSVLDYAEVRDPEIVGNLNANKVLLVLDDIEVSCVLYKSDFKKIKRKYNVDIFGKYKIIKCIGPEAGYVAMKYIESHRVDYAILDITLGTSKKLSDGNLVQIDGVDVAKMLTSKYSAKYRFSTAHTLNRKNPSMKKAIDKYELGIGGDVMNIYMDKNGNRSEDIAQLLEINTKD